MEPNSNNNSMDTNERLKQRGKNMMTLPVVLSGSNGMQSSSSSSRNHNNATFSVSRRKRRRDPSSATRLMTTTTTTAMMLILITIILLTYVACQYYFQHIVLPQQIKIQEQVWEQRHILPLKQEYHERLEALQRTKETLQQQLLLLESNNNNNTKKDNDNDDKITAMQKRIDKLVHTKQHLQKSIQFLSKRAVLHEFGPGPHHVQMTVQFDPASNIVVDDKQNNNNNNNDTAVIVLEMAPLDLMPHAVYWFLNQVHAGLYDNCSFHRNAGHVLQAGPVAPNFETNSNISARRHQDLVNKQFQNAGLTNILFQEYSPAYPHQPYTVGYAGRPGGPDFYISTRNNTKNHGPFGQTSYEDPSEADPCFAKVIQGLDVIHKMEQSAVQPGGYKRMQHYVAIREMKVLSLSQKEGSHHQDIEQHEEHHDLPAGMQREEEEENEEAL